MNRKTEDLERVVKNALVVQGARNQEERVREIGRNLRKAAASHASKDLMVQVALAVIQTGLEQEESTPATLAEARLRGRLGEWQEVIEMSKERKKTVERLEILEAGIEGTGEGQINARERLRDEIGREGREAIGRGVKEDERLRLAGVLYASDPDTATEVLRSGARHGEQKIRLETAMTRIRTVAALERMRAEVEGREEEEEEEGEDEKLAEMLERGALAMSSKSANGVIKATRGIRDDGTKARILSQWVKGNAEHPEACSVAILAVDIAVRSETYIPDGLFFEEVSEVLGRRKGRSEAELANKVEWQQQEGISIEPKWAGAKVKARCMAQKWIEGETEEGRLDLVQCYEEFIEMAEEDQETGIGDRLTCAAIVVAETRRLEKRGLERRHMQCEGTGRVNATGVHEGGRKGECRTSEALQRGATHTCKGKRESRVRVERQNKHSRTKGGGAQNNRPGNERENEFGGRRCREKVTQGGRTRGATGTRENTANRWERRKIRRSSRRVGRTIEASRTAFSQQASNNREGGRS